MSEHWIRLRGAWERYDLAAVPAVAQRVTLPLQRLDAPIRLVRRFNTPPLDPGCESLVLRLEHVPGLVAVRLNGAAYDGPLASDLTIPLDSFGPLAARYELVLEVDPPDVHHANESWGQIALVVARENGPGGACDAESGVG